MFAVQACSETSYEASVSPQEGLLVTYAVKTMFGIHSDWTRAIRVKYGSNEIQEDLFEDTGWWRGSHLYRHKSGVYVIHEGQLGCFGFSVEPLSFDIQADVSCRKDRSTQRDSLGTSPFYLDLTYLGTFVETPDSPDGAPISFIPRDVKPETELPDLL